MRILIINYEFPPLGGGAVILKRVNLFVLGIPMAIASHFFLDAIPGWDVGLTSVKT